jgi:nucleoside-triphosphatase THEP1
MLIRLPNGKNSIKMNKNQREIWLKAAVIGSIWASFEMIFGSFFHSLRLPFAGTFLTLSSMVLLIAFSYKWQDKNLFIKAGIIAALMRSLMPTSVILGPLIGIITEAFLFQWSINLLGRNTTAFVLAAILSVFSALIHKIISIILIYGFDIVKILENLYLVFLKTTHLQLPLNQLFTVIIVIYVTLGFITAFTGKKVGMELLTNTVGQAGIKGKWQIKNDLFQIKNFPYKYYFIIIHLFSLILFLFLLEWYPLKYIIVPVFIYFVLLYKRYGNSFRRLAKPVFWLQLLIIVLLAVWLWQDKTAGLITGIKMIIRAVLVVSIFTAISVELKNPLVKALLYKKGYSQLYAVLGLSASALPYILKNLSIQKKDFLNPLKILKKSIALSDELLQIFKMQLQQKNKIYIISGNTRSGKTTFLKNIIKHIKKINPDYQTGGIIAHGIDKNGERFGFEIENIKTGEKQLLCSRNPVENAEKTGRFYFLKQGFNFGKQAILSNLTDLDLLVIDEIGYLELKGKGWFDAIEQVLKHENPDMIFVVRKRILEQILKLWQHIDIEVIDINNSQAEQIANNITERIKQRKHI